MNLGNIARVVTVAAACLAAVGSATSNSNPPAVTPQTNNSPPPPQEMDAARALGLWRSTFGAVKIEADNSRGGIQAGAIQGVWMYQRQGGEEVIGYFSGNLRGNVLQFRWQEPNNPPLTGEGYLVFDQQGRQYSGRWWSDKRDRVGDWNGWRQASAQQPYGQYGQPATGAQPYGGTTYGDQAQPNPYGGTTYGNAQPQPYPPAQPQYPQNYPQQPQPAPQQPQYPQQPAQPQYPQTYPAQPQPYYPPPR